MQEVEACMDGILSLNLEVEACMDFLKGDQVYDILCWVPNNMAIGFDGHVVDLCLWFTILFGPFVT